MLLCSLIAATRPGSVIRHIVFLNFVLVALADYDVSIIAHRFSGAINFERNRQELEYFIGFISLYDIICLQQVRDTDVKTLQTILPQYRFVGGNSPLVMFNHEKIAPGWPSNSTNVYNTRSRAKNSWILTIKFYLRTSNSQSFTLVLPNIAPFKTFGPKLVENLYELLYEMSTNMKQQAPDHAVFVVGDLPIIANGWRSRRLYSSNDTTELILDPPITAIPGHTQFYHERWVSAAFKIGRTKGIFAVAKTLLSSRLQQSKGMLHPSISLRLKFSNEKQALQFNSPVQLYDSPASVAGGQSISKCTPGQPCSIEVIPPPNAQPGVPKFQNVHPTNVQKQGFKRRASSSFGQTAASTRDEVADEQTQTDFHSELYQSSTRSHYPEHQAFVSDDRKRSKGSSLDEGSSLYVIPVNAGFPPGYGRRYHITDGREMTASGLPPLIGSNRHIQQVAPAPQSRTPTQQFRQPSTSHGAGLEPRYDSEQYDPRSHSKTGPHRRTEEQGEWLTRADVASEELTKLETPGSAHNLEDYHNTATPYEFNLDRAVNTDSFGKYVSPPFQRQSTPTADATDLTSTNYNYHSRSTETHQIIQQQVSAAQSEEPIMYPAYPEPSHHYRDVQGAEPDAGDSQMSHLPKVTFEIDPRNTADLNNLYGHQLILD